MLRMLYLLGCQKSLKNLDIIWIIKQEVLVGASQILMVMNSFGVCLRNCTMKITQGFCL